MNKEIVYWKQKDGTFIDIMSMDVNHLRNVLKMIVKNSNKHKIQKTPVQIANETSYEIGSTGWIKAKQQAEFKLNDDIANEFNNTDIDHHEFESDLGFDFNSLEESMEIGNNELGHY
jgi:hypothetical protein